MAKMLTKVKLSEHKYKTPEGYLICQDAVLARTGKQEYLKSEVYPNFSGVDEPIMVDRKPEQVFATETLASFEDKPVTVEHPDESVTPENYSELSVGHTRNVRKGTYNGQDVMIADLVITDAQTIEDIENGIRTELSCGYDCDVTEGENPEQINIRGNHVALCEQGRAGIAKIIDSKTTDNTDIELRVIGEPEEIQKVETYVREKNLNCEYSTSRTLWISNIAQDYIMEVAKDIAKKFDVKVTFSLVKKEKKLIYSDSNKIDYKEFIKAELKPEYIYDENNYIIAQFESYEDAMRAVNNSKLKNLDTEIDYDNSAVFLQYLKSDIDSLMNTTQENQKANNDDSRYIIYAKGTKKPDNSALFWVGKDRPRYMKESDAPKFTKEYAEKIEGSKGTYEWIKKEVDITTDSVIEKKYVVYQENGKIKGTPYDNYIATIRDKNKIIDFNEFFDDINQVVKYLLEFTELKREDIITSDSIVKDSTNYREKFYENSKKLLEKKLKKLEDLDEKIKDGNEEEYNIQKQKLREELKKQLKSCEEALDENQVNDSDPLSLNIKSWYMSQYPTDEVGKTLNDTVTFQDLFDCLDNYRDVYELLGGDCDSIVRERCFKKLAILIDTDYDYIYNQWLKANE